MVTPGCRVAGSCKNTQTVRLKLIITLKLQAANQSEVTALDMWARNIQNLHYGSYPGIPISR